MEKSFWDEAWQTNQIGFHQEQINPFLKKYFSRLGLSKGQKVFVPLCGKSKDMTWIYDQGMKVEGIELIKKAVDEFYDENPKHKEIKIHNDDILETDKLNWDQYNAMFDRGSLIALTPNQRRKYYEVLREQQVPKILLTTVEYNQSLMDGPPHSVTKSEIMENLGSLYKVNLLERIDATKQYRDSPEMLVSYCYYLLSTD